MKYKQQNNIYQLFTKAPDLDTRVIATRYNFIFTQRKTANGRLVTHESGSASPFFAGPHLARAEGQPYVDSLEQ
jgi:hypothetical protein